MPIATYSIRPFSWVVRDQNTEPDPHLIFHLRSGDYLATLSTYLGVLQEILQDAITKNESPQQQSVDLLKGMRKDLNYVHKEYRIVPKNNRLS